MTGAGFGSAARRVAAMAVDWLVICCYAAALVPLGLFFVDRSVGLSPVGWNAVAFVLLIVPATGWLAGWESGPGAASPGKRLLRLKVVGPGRPRLGWRRALARNGLKVALPWELGHTAAFVLSDATAARSLVVLGMACSFAACLLAAGYVASLFVGTGRTPYDRATGTRVIRSSDV
jgi:uncharacterized RDD family membrane protein YckC